MLSKLLVPRLMIPAFIAALALTLFMALDPLPPSTPLDRYGDKTEHMLAFFTLAILSSIGFPRVRARHLFEHLSFLGALIEVFQASPMIHRDCDWTDWVADSIAVALALAAMRWAGPMMARREAARNAARAPSDLNGSDRAL